MSSIEGRGGGGGGVTRNVYNLHVSNDSHCSAVPTLYSISYILPIKAHRDFILDLLLS